MASSKEYLEFILGQLSELEEITYRAMMGEFIIYYRGKIVGGIYDDRLLVKPVKSAISYMPTAPYELPYEGAKEMLLVEENVASLRSVEVATPPCAAKAAIPCGLAVRKQHKMLFAASKFEKLNTEKLTVDWSHYAKS